MDFRSYAHPHRLQTDGLQPQSLMTKIDALKQENLALLDRIRQREDALVQLKQDYDRKLGAVEYENEMLKQNQRSIEENHGDRRMKIDEELKAIEADNLKKDSALAASQAQVSTLSNKLRVLENYLADLPTPTDYTNFQNQYGKLKNDNQRLVSENQKMYDNVLEAERQLRDKVVALKGFEDREHVMQLHIDDLTDKLQRRNTTIPVQRLSRDVIEDLKSDAQRWRNNYESAVRQTQFLVKSQDEAEARADKEKEELRAALTSERSIVASLEKIIQSRHAEVNKQRNRIVSLCEEKQGLLSQMLDMREKASQMDVIVNSGWFRRQRCLASDLCDCVRDVKSVLRVITHCMKGAVPDPSELFQLSDPVPSNQHDKESNLTLSFQYLDASINQVKELRSDIDSIRRFLSDRLAENIGSEVSCVVQ